MSGCPWILFCESSIFTCGEGSSFTAWRSFWGSTPNVNKKRHLQFLFGGAGGGVAPLDDEDSDDDKNDDRENVNAKKMKKLGQNHAKWFKNCSKRSKNGSKQANSHFKQQSQWIWSTHLCLLSKGAGPRTIMDHFEYSESARKRTSTTHITAHFRYRSLGGSVPQNPQRT